MSAAVETLSLAVLLRGDPGALAAGTARLDKRNIAFLLGMIVVGAGLFGAAMGLWRAPLQAAYAAVKFPGIILLTVLGNALINGLLAPLLGLNIRFEQTLLLVLSSFAIACAILGAFSPLILFLVWNLPPLVEGARGNVAAYSGLNLTVVLVIALAGMASNVQLHRLLQTLSGSRAIANRLLLAWLAVNLLLGSQLTWILRPFIGTPLAPVQFLRPDAFQGNFFETVLQHLMRGLFGAT